MSGRPLSERIVIDDQSDMLIVDGVRFAAAVFDFHLVPTPPGRWFRVVKVDSAVTIETKTEEVQA